VIRNSERGTLIEGILWQRHMYYDGASLAASDITQANKHIMHRSAITKDQQAVLRKSLSLLKAFRTIRRRDPGRDQAAELF
jgi:hypothetical protein